jgi:hypothetical protein
MYQSFIFTFHKLMILLPFSKYFPKSVTCVQNNSNYFVLKRTFMYVLLQKVKVNIDTLK